MNQKVFLSFSGLLGAIASGGVTPADLGTGLFMFGCSRGHALNPGAGGERDEREWNASFPAAYDVLLPALLAAESDGRAGWRHEEPGVRRTAYDVLNKLLARMALAPLPEVDDVLPLESYPGMRDFLADQKIPLSTVW